LRYSSHSSRYFRLLYLGEAFGKERLTTDSTDGNGTVLALTLRTIVRPRV